MTDIVFASNNRDKWLELVDDFKNEGINLIYWRDEYDSSLRLIENDQTLVANSFSKAYSAAIQTQKMALGDDSGIFVRARDYWPGVYSRRWYGEEKDDLGRCKKLLEEMYDEEDRETYLTSRFVLVDREGKKLFSTVVKNTFELATEIHGEHGFGYDPVLIPKAALVLDAMAHGKIEKERAFEIVEKKMSIADLTQIEKNAVNNRGRIAKEIKNFLNNIT